MVSKIQVDASHYFKGYDLPPRWLSYYTQAKLSVRFAEGRILEIGVGNKTVSNYLKEHSVNLVTCDYDKKLKPDITADVCNLPFKKGKFSSILCFEVLEHLPFDKLRDVLKQLNNLSNQYLVISVPHFLGFFGEIAFKIPSLKKTTIQLRIPFPVKHKIGNQHYWELGKRKYPVRRLRKLFNL